MMEYITGVPDLDFDILVKFIDDNDLKNCFLNKSITLIIQSDSFWRNRFINRWDVRDDKPKQITWKEYYFFYRKYPYDKDNIAKSLGFTEEMRYIRRMVDENKAVEGIDTFPLKNDYLYYAILSGNEKLVQKFSNVEKIQDETILLIIRKNRLDILDIFLTPERYPFNSDLEKVEKKILFELGKIGAYDYYTSKYISNNKKNSVIRYFVEGLISEHHNDYTLMFLTKGFLISESYYLLKHALVSKNEYMLTFLNSKGCDIKDFEELNRELLFNGYMSIETYKTKIFCQGFLEVSEIMYYYKIKDYTKAKFYSSLYHMDRDSKIEFDIYTYNDFEFVCGLDIFSHSPENEKNFTRFIQYKEIKVEEFRKIFNELLKAIEYGSPYGYVRDVMIGAVDNNRRDLVECALDELIPYFKDNYHSSVIIVNELFIYLQENKNNTNLDLMIYITIKTIEPMEYFNKVFWDVLSKYSYKNIVKLCNKEITFSEYLLTL